MTEEEKARVEGIAQENLADRALAKSVHGAARSDRPN